MTSNSKTTTDFLVVILIALLAAALVIAIALLFQGDGPTPPDREPKTARPPKATKRNISKLDTDELERASGE